MPALDVVALDDYAVDEIAVDVVSERLESLDVSLFDRILTQSSVGDRRAWLAVQRSMRLPSGYDYLEIGSHLGGSLQQHLLDPLCRSIYSIDNRSVVTDDDRGHAVEYEGNSTDRMLNNLRCIAENQLSKVSCFDGDAGEIGEYELTSAPNFCFIDGQHTKAAVVSDFEFCLRVCAPDAAICFHDDYIIHPALRLILSRLRQQGISFTARKLSGCTFGIFLGDCPAAHDPYVLQHSVDGLRWLRSQPLRQMVPRWLSADGLRQMVPDWLRPIARRAVKLLNDQRLGHEAAPAQAGLAGCR